MEEKINTQNKLVDNLKAGIKKAVIANQGAIIKIQMILKYICQ
jgi:hypothetical protein